MQRISTGVLVNKMDVFNVYAEFYCTGFVSRNLEGLAQKGVWLHLNSINKLFDYKEIIPHYMWRMSYFRIEHKFEVTQTLVHTKIHWLNIH